MSNYLPVRTESTFTEKALDSNFNRRSRQRGPKVREIDIDGTVQTCTRHSFAGKIKENITQGTQNTTTQTRNKEKH